LPYAVEDLFADWLDRHLPDRKNTIFNRIRDLRGGVLNDPHLGSRMHGQGVWADNIHQNFHLHATRLGFNNPHTPLSTAHFRRPPPAYGQITLFDS
jgi:hypothetical protein